MAALRTKLTRYGRALGEGTVRVTASMVTAVGLRRVNIVTTKDT
jgi:hypothetical protein